MRRFRLVILAAAILMVTGLVTSVSIVGAAPVSPATVGGCPAGPCPTANGPLIEISKTASPTSLPAGGGSVTYTYTVTNGGNVPLSGVTVTDNTCSPVTYVGGDTNGNGLLDLTETWTYTCTTTITVTTTNTATAQGTSSSGVGTSATATATVMVGCSSLAGANCTPPPSCPPGTPNCPTPTPCLPTVANCPTPTPTCPPTVAGCPTPTPSPTPCPPASVPNCQPVPASICVLKFNDLNGNGYKGASEPPLAGVTMTISPAVPPVSQVTPASGQTCWTVPPGTYTVTESGPLTAGAWVPTTPVLAPSRSQTTTVAAGQTVQLLFGDHQFLIDHFECYLVRPTGLPSPITGISLHDQFGSRDAAATSRFTLCNPAQKVYAGTITPILTPLAHLVCYRTPPSPTAVVPVGPTVRTTDQFGSDVLRVGQPVTLCLPSSKSLVDQYLPVPDGLSHFACYAVTDLSPVSNRTVRLIDEFGRRTAVVIRPVALCNPVQKTFGGTTSRILDSVDHLVCYTIKATASRLRTVWINNQFEQVPLTVVRPYELCVPALKRVLLTPLRVP